jgi:DNA-binding NtrC family response regulator
VGAPQRIVICERDDTRRRSLTAVLSADTWQVRDIARLSALTDRSLGFDPALVLIGFSAAEARETFAVVKSLRDVDRRLPIVLVAANSSEALAVAALRAGAKDYFRDPVDYPAVAASVRRWLSSPDERAPGRGGASGAGAPAGRLIGPSQAMRGIEAYVAKVAHRDVTVLITGETGTGKELVASLIHTMSPRHRGRFVSVNCAAIPEGLLESELFGHESGAFTGAASTRQGLLQLADRGTVFLDEVGDMGLQAQAKLLRAVETREVYRVGGTKPIPLDIRVVAATNQDLEAAVDGGRFRRDLFYRLNVARVHLPPLREHSSDVTALLDHFLQDLNARFGEQVEGFTDEALATLQAYEWPGNVRELKNLLEAVFICSPRGRLTVDDLPETFRARLRGFSNLSAPERQQLIDALGTANWNKSEAARLLHWSRMTLYRKIAKYSVIKSDLHRR